jgi:hypothetical protein
LIAIDPATAGDALNCCGVGDVEDPPAEKRQHDCLQLRALGLNFLGYNFQVVP